MSILLAEYYKQNKSAAPLPNLTATEQRFTEFWNAIISNLNFTYSDIQLNQPRKTYCAFRLQFIIALLIKSRQSEP